MQNYRWTSCIPILDFLITNFDIKSVLEFGAGDSSTLFFLNKDIKLITIENEGKWFTEYYHHGMNDANYLLQNFDMIFVDGDFDRWRHINKAFNQTPIIVTHDTNVNDENTYNWHLIDMPSYFQRYDFIKEVPWTTIFSNNHKVIEAVKKFGDNYVR